LLRGEVIVKNGQYVGFRSQGQFIPAKPYGAAYQSLEMKGGEADVDQRIAIG
jgi:hypothetical protein